jgi:hypothetical protein
MTWTVRKLGIATRIGACLLLLLGLFGCSQGANNAHEPTSTEVHPLTFPVTITLSTPSTLSPTAPVVLGSSSVKLGSRAQVVTGTTVSMGSAGLSADPDAVMNDTWSRGTANLGDRDKVRGILHAKAHVFGSSVSAPTIDANPAFDPVQTLSWKVTYPSGTATDVTVNSGTKVLAPGLYGTITVNSPGAITLKTGIYYLTGLGVNSGAVVNLDQAHGPVIIYTTSTLFLRGKFVTLDGASPDLMIAYLGTAAIFVEAVYNGALLAPSASVTFRSVGATHTGYFAALNPILDAGAMVAYAPPLAVITASGPTTDCRKLLANNVPAASLAKFCPICHFNTSDTDRDGVLDCVDACPSDPLKSTDPGKCGCGVPDTDTDGDGVPDCLETCDFDPNNTEPGECGCKLPPDAVIPPTLKPAGTPCNDTGCPLTTGATCNGQGVCGNRNACMPATGCVLRKFESISYWFCPGPATESTASAACRSKQMSLVRINTPAENDFVTRFATGPMWIGANSLGAAGVWRWANVTTNNGDQFWQGAANGAQRNSLYSAWESKAPASQSCAVLQQSDGRWVDVDCTESLGYVCESPMPAPLNPNPPQPPPPGMNNQPRDGGADGGGACVPLANSKLPGDLNTLQNDYNSAATTAPTGAAASPPPDGSTNCIDDPSTDQIGQGNGAGCDFQRVTEPSNFQCTVDSDCNSLGSGLVCRQVKNDLNCDAGDGTGLGTVCDDGDAGCRKLYCPTGAHCGKLNCPPIDPPTRCDQIEVCNPDASFNITALDPDASLPPSNFDPSGMFDGGVLPDASPSSTYVDPAQGTGRNHTWCFMKPQNPVPGANQPETGNTGKSGGSSSIKFRFNPDLGFKADVNPLSLGETSMKVDARAQLIVGVDMNNVFNSGLNFSADILRAVGDIQADRCTIRNDETELTVLGGDFITGDEDFIFNTADRPIIIDGHSIDLTQETKECNTAVGDFINFTNRAKKAFRDAQQLLTQYQQLKSAGTSLTTLCQDVMGLVSGTGAADFFPGGLSCPPNEPPEVTIQRFMDYYQAPGFGQVEQLKQAINKLVTITNDLKNKLSITQTFTLTDIGRQESQTIMNVPFAIGPVPMVLEVDAFYSYGLAGYFEFALQFPFNPLDVEIGKREEIAHVKAGVLPHAGAGLSAFVGAGTSLGGFSATLGVEGSIKLGDLKAPIFAGAGVGAIATQDVRPFEPALQIPGVGVAAQLVGLDKITHFGIPTKFKFDVWYDYGAGLEADNILQGSLNARLRIKFFFFSRTWRKQIIQFNGFSFHKDLVSGKTGSDPGVGVNPETTDPNNPDASTTTNTVQGQTDLGLDEPQTPLAVLQPVSVVSDAAAPAPTGSAHFDAGAMEAPFYDNECCARPGEVLPVNVDQCTGAFGDAGPSDPPVANGASPCCPGSRCIDPIDTGTRCIVDCKTQGQTCATNTDCCPVANHDVTCGSGGTCVECGHAATDTSGAACTQDSDCCGFDAPDSLVLCGESHTCQIVCHSQGDSCQTVSDCCTGPGLQTTCGEDHSCDQCVVTDGGAECGQDTDCCDFDPAENDTVRCLTPIGGGTPTCHFIIG